MSYRVVLTDPDQHPPEDAYSAILEACGGRLEAELCAGREALRAFCAGADAVLGSRTPLTASVIESMPACRVIARMSTGWDTVDVRAAGRAGIPVTNVPDFCTDSVAEQTMALMLACVRKVVRLDREVRRGIWDPSHVLPTSGLSGKVLGLVGFGKIGQAVARRALGFALRVVYYDPAGGGHADPTKQACASLGALLDRADIVSLHVPLNEKTRGLIGNDQLQRMKPTSILINCSRGSVVVEPALVEALETGRIAGAALDVLEKEPPSERSRLLALPNVTLSPHCAGHTDETMRDLRRRAYEEVARALSGEPLLHVVNQDCLRPRGDRSSRRKRPCL